MNYTSTWFTLVNAVVAVKFIKNNNKFINIISYI